MSGEGWIRNEEVGDDCREQFSRNFAGTIAHPIWRGWNEAMLLWLSNVKLGRPEEPNDVPVLYQTPERAYAEYVRPTTNDQVQLPVISFAHAGADFNRERFFGSKGMVFQRTFDGSKYQVARKPMPWDINYVVTIWTKYQQDMDVVLYNYISRFTPDSYLQWNGIPAKLSLTSVTDTGILEPGEATDRVLRQDLSFTAEAWVQQPEQEVGVIGGVDITLDNDNNVDNSIIFDISQDTNIIEGDFSLDDQQSSNGREPQSAQVVTEDRNDS
jgi:hypothetical protein